MMDSTNAILFSNIIQNRWVLHIKLFVTPTKCGWGDITLRFFAKDKSKWCAGSLNTDATSNNLWNKAQEF